MKCLRFEVIVTLNKKYLEENNASRKIPLFRRRLRWKGNIKIDLKYDMTVWNGFMWLRMEVRGRVL
jgi:hypothetical protein